MCFIHGQGDAVHEEMEFRESFSLAEYRLTDFGEQTVPLKCYRGTLADPKWVDQEEGASFTYFPSCSLFSRSDSF